MAVKGAYILGLKSKRLLNNQGQAMTEYILIIAVTVSFFVMLSSMISRIGLAKRLTSAITGPFAAAYQFGHTKAKGYDNGGPIYHPRVIGGENNFRLFFGTSVTSQ